MRRTYTASEFKAKCLVLLEQVERTKEPIVITKRGKPVARLVPHLFGLLKGRVEIVGDIISPIDVEWEALK
ncbi:MAG: type II toxin-antitoxin system Phd/YefM family antitoxin [Xanthobacteraceae bacterium]|jgi:prevent-host-death family protein